MDNFCIASRATSTVFAADRGLIDDAEYRERVQRILDSDNQNGRRALARVAADVQPSTARMLIDQLIEDDDIQTRRSIYDAVAHQDDPRLGRHLLHGLEDPRTRSAARDTLVKMGIEVTELLRCALTDPEWVPVAWRVPEIVAKLPTEVATPILTDALLHPRDGLLAYRLLRALEGVQARGDGRISPQALDTAYATALSHMKQLTTAAAALLPALDPAVDLHAMLTELLEAKRAHVAERALRLWSLRTRRENISLLLHGLQGVDARAQASSLELIDGWVPKSERALFRAHFQGRPAPEITAAGGLSVPPPLQALNGLADSSSSSLSQLAHAILEEGQWS